MESAGPRAKQNQIRVAEIEGKQIRADEIDGIPVGNDRAPLGWTSTAWIQNVESGTRVELNRPSQCRVRKLTGVDGDVSIYRIDSNDVCRNRAAALQKIPVRECLKILGRDIAVHLHRTFGI